MGTTQDITVQMGAQQKILRLNRTFAVLSNINQLIVRERNRQELFQGACRIAIEDGQFRMAWIGMLNELSGQITPVAYAGVTDGYLEHLKISIADTSEGRGPTGIALREDCSIICNDIEHDDRFLPWRERALALGFRSSAAFPLHAGDKLIGVINFYSGEKHFFDSDEVRLIEELAMDISFSLESLRIEEERKKVHTALRESEERLRKAQSMAHVGNWEIDLHTQRIWGSEEAFNIYGIERVGVELPLMVVQSCVRPEYRPALDKALQQLLTGTRVYDEKFQIIRVHDGEVRHIHSKAELIRDANRNPVKVVGVLQDITELERAEEERRKYEEQLLQAQKLESIGTLAAGIAHDFNNILNIILGYTSLLAERIDDTEKTARRIKTILSATERGSQLVQQLLTFARKATIDRHPISLNNIILETAKLIDETFPKTIEVGLQLKPGLPEIFGDHNQLHQVLVNLCVNSRDAMPNGGLLTVSTEDFSTDALKMRIPKPTSQRYAVITVKDSGAGIDESTLRKIYDPFFTTKQQGKGTGLGLAVVLGIVQSHLGFIEVESKLGSGTEFRIYLPCSEQKESSSPNVESQISTSPGGTETILFVEDESSSREMVRELLQGKGYIVLTAANGEEAISLFESREQEISLVISDLGLPKCEGTEVCRRVKMKRPNLPFILMTGFLDPERKDEISKVGVNELLLKPYQLGELLMKMRELLDRR
ncbi:MAG: GAF domain-containing protein [bacterium]